MMDSEKLALLKAAIVECLPDLLNNVAGYHDGADVRLARLREVLKQID